MKIIATLILFMSLAVMASDEQSTDWGNPEKVKQSVQIDYDEFSKLKTYNGPKMGDNMDFHKFPSGNVSLQMVYMSVLANLKKGTTIYFINIAEVWRQKLINNKEKWRNYKKAYDSDGNKLRVFPVEKKFDSCNINGCVYSEVIIIATTRKYLKKQLKNGLRFKVYGNNISKIFFIPNGYIKGMLAAVPKRFK